MGAIKLAGIELKGLSVAIPKTEVSNLDYPFLEEKEKELIVRSIGITKRRIAGQDVTVSDLCYKAAAELFDKLDWDKEEISVLIFVTQTPDYLTPCTAAIMQHRLELSEKCLAFDVNLGCSGFPYGLATVGSFLQSIPGGKGILLIGDKSSQIVSPDDKSTALLFSDAGSAIALENTGRETKMIFDLNTYGGGMQSLMIKDGGSRYPFNKNSLDKKKIKEGIERSGLNLQMNGIDIFNLVAKRVIPSIEEVLKENRLNVDDFDYFFFHQANKIINEHLRKVLKIEKGKAPSVLHLFGNASAASIPLTMVVTSLKDLSKGKHRLMLAGFGVGLSWGIAIVETENLISIPLLEV